MPEFTTAALIASMQRATEDVRARVAVLLDQATTGVVQDHQQQMPRSGATTRKFRDQPLADRVRVRTYDSLRKVVTSEGPHLHFVELGTKERDTRPRPSKSGRRKRVAYVTHRTGAMPKLGPIFIPLVVKRRAEFLRVAEDLIGEREL
ncbi:MAG: hypothetical protein IPO08_21540 [Xanthomonadales bacterium]|nr:hypothetical protein [Xanthomonadales bacterium]